jgi:CCR4-NOT transcriptional regulation complex NOT5 subunit
LTNEVKEILIKKLCVNNVYEYFKFHNYNIKAVINSIKENEDIPHFILNFFETIEYLKKRNKGEAFLEEDYFKKEFTSEIKDAINESI